MHYEGEDVLILLLLLEGLVGIQLSQIPCQQTATVGSPLASRKNIVTVNVDGSHFVLVALEGALHLQRRQVPNRHRPVAGRHE